MRSGRVEWCCPFVSNRRFSRNFVTSDTERMAAKRARPYQERRGRRSSDFYRMIPPLKRIAPSSSFGSSNAGLVWSTTPLSTWRMCCAFRQKSRSATYNKCTYLQHIKNCTVVCMFLLKGRMQHNNLSLPAEPKWSNHPCQLEKSCLCGWVLWHHQGDPLQRERTCWEQENSWRGI